jgi:hypothetical protein
MTDGSNPNVNLAQSFFALIALLLPVNMCIAETLEDA